MIIFDSRDIQYRSPFGAVAAGTAVRFAPHVLQDDATVTLRLWVNDHEELIYGVREGDRAVFEFTPEKPGLVWYYFVIDSPEGRHYYGGSGGKGVLTHEPGAAYQLTVYDGSYTTPKWFQRSIAYQIFPDRFYRPGEILGVEEHLALNHKTYIHHGWDEPVNYLPIPGDKHYSPCDYYGGNLWGVAEKLPYLKSLGVSCIYLNPIFLSSSNHRYNTADYLHVDPMLGGDEALVNLVERAKEQGIKLMLDGVFSHTGDDSVYFDRYRIYGGGACSDPNSPYKDWYDFQSYPDKYRSWWGFETLPEVEEMTPSYMEFIGKVIDHYASLGITNWRLDVADELPDEFIEFLRKRIKANDPEGVILGEVWEDASHKVSLGARRRYVDGFELDSVMDYPFRDAMVDFFSGKINAEGAQDRLLSLMENYPLPFYLAQLNLMDSHDEVRIITAISGSPARNAQPREEQIKYHLSPEALKQAKERFRSAAAIQFTLPGVPCIYYGSEAGVTGMGDPFNRATYPWGNEDEELVDYFRELGSIHTSNPDLTENPCCGIAYQGENILALLRGKVICAVNSGDKEAHASLTAPMFTGNGSLSIPDGEYRDALTGESVYARQGRLDFSIPPCGRRIFIKVQ